MVTQDRPGRQASMAETVVVVVDSLDRDPVEGCLGEPGVGVYASNDRAIALDGSGLAAAGFEVVDVGGEKFADCVASRRPMGVELGCQLGQKSLNSSVMGQSMGQTPNPGLWKFPVNPSPLKNQGFCERPRLDSNQRHTV